MEQKNKFPWLSAILLSAILLSLAYIIFRPAEPHPISPIQHRIDTIYIKRDTIYKEAVKASKNNVIKSNKLTKSLPRETPKIIDTTDAAMYEYISNYKPGTSIEAE